MSIHSSQYKSHQVSNYLYVPILYLQSISSFPPTNPHLYMPKHVGTSIYNYAVCGDGELRWDKDFQICQDDVWLPACSPIADPDNKCGPTMQVLGAILAVISTLFAITLAVTVALILHTLKLKSKSAAKSPDKFLHW